MSDLEDILDDYHAYNEVMCEDSTPGEGCGSGCFTWAMRLLIIYFILRAIADIFY